MSDQEIELTGNLLIIAVRGGLIIQRDEEVLVLHQGEACLIAAGSLVITEVPTSTAGGVDLVYCFFGDRSIRQRFPDIAKVERMALAMSPVSTELFRLRNFLPHLLPVMQIAGFTFPSDLTKLLNFTFNHGWAAGWMFLKGFFERRRRLHLHLEQHVLPVRTVQQVEDSYWGGRRRFRRDFRAHYDIPVERWLKWRRLQVARTLIRHGPLIPLEDIATATGYAETNRFRHRFRARFGLWPEEVPRLNDYTRLSPSKLRGALTPFWHWSFTGCEQTRDHCLAFLVRTHRKQLPQWQQRRLRRYETEESIPVKACATPFLAAAQVDLISSPTQRTGFDKFLEIERFLDPKEVPSPLVDAA